MGRGGGGAAGALAPRDALRMTPWRLEDGAGGRGGAAGAAAVPAAPAIGRSTLRLIGSPQLGQKRSSPLWMAAQRGQAVMPASRRTVTGWRSERLASRPRSSASMRVSVASLASTSESLRWPKRCRL